MNTDNWQFKNFTGRRLLLHTAATLLLAAAAVRQMIVSESFATGLIIAAVYFYFRYIFQYWKGWNSSQGRRQYIRLHADEMEYRVFPAGEGRLKYSQIRYLYIKGQDQRNRQRKSKLVIEYLLPEEDENSPDLHEMTFCLDFLLPPKGLGKSRTAIPDLGTQTDAFTAALRARCPNIYSEIQRESLNYRAWLEEEKEKTRKWLERFKKQ